MGQSQTLQDNVAVSLSTLFKHLQINASLTALSYLIRLKLLAGGTSVLASQTTTTIQQQESALSTAHLFRILLGLRMALEISACVYQTTTSIQRLKNALSTVPSFHILLEPWK